jgi:general secretion pathway protein J
MMCRARARREGGFTLIELLIVIAILGGMMVLAYASIHQVVKTSKLMRRSFERSREARVLLSRITRDLSMAYVLGNEDRTKLLPRTYFVGESAGEVDSLTFSALAHVRLYAESNEGDQSVIAYYGAADETDRSRTNIVRRETRRLENEKLEDIPGEADVIFTDVERFKVEYFKIVADQAIAEWTDSWDSQNDDGGTKDRLPDRVRVTLVYKDDDGKETTLITQTRIYIQEMVQGYAQ